EFPPLLVDYLQHVRRRSQLPRSLHADLAVGRAKRSARRATDDRYLSRNQGHTWSAGVSAEYLPNRRHESLPVMSSRLCVSHLERQLDTRSRKPAVAAQAAQRTYRDLAVPVLKLDRRRLRA